MDKPNTCIICGSSNIHDDGIEVDVDPDDYWHTAGKNFRCQECKALWQYSVTVQIEFDYSKPQIELPTYPDEHHWIYGDDNDAS